MDLAILQPEKLERHATLTQFLMDRVHVRLRSRCLARWWRWIEESFQRGIGEVSGQWPPKTDAIGTAKQGLNRLGMHAKTAGNPTGTQM